MPTEELFLADRERPGSGGRCDRASECCGRRTVVLPPGFAARGDGGRSAGSNSRKPRRCSSPRGSACPQGTPGGSGATLVASCYIVPSRIDIDSWCSVSPLRDDWTAFEPDHGPHHPAAPSDSATSDLGPSRGGRGTLAARRPAAMCGFSPVPHDLPRWERISRRPWAIAKTPMATSMMAPSGP